MMPAVHRGLDHEKLKQGLTIFLKKRAYYKVGEFLGQEMIEQ